MASTGQFAEHLAPGLREIVGTRLGGRESYYSRLLKVETSSRNYEDYLAGAGLPVAIEKPEGQPITVFDPLEGLKKRIAHTTYGIGAEFTEEAFDDDLYKSQGSALTAAGNGLADSMAEVVELQAHRFFNAEAFLGAAVPDFLRPLPDYSATIGLYSTAHAPVAGGESGTQSNRPAAAVDFTVTSYRTALTQFKRYRTDRNLRIPGVSFPNRLIVPPEVEYDAKEVVNSQNRPDTANRVENVSRGMVEIIVDPYLDDVDAWFLLAPEHKLVFLWRKRPMMDSFDDRWTRTAVMLTWQRFSQAAVHWLGTYGSPGV